MFIDQSSIIVREHDFCVIVYQFRGSSVGSSTLVGATLRRDELRPRGPTGPLRNYQMPVGKSPAAYAARAARLSPIGSQQYVDVRELRWGSIRRVPPRLHSQTRDMSEGTSRDANVAQIHSRDGFLIRGVSRSGAAGVWGAVGNLGDECKNSARERAARE